MEPDRPRTWFPWPGTARRGSRRTAVMELDQPRDGFYVGVRGLGPRASTEQREGAPKATEHGGRGGI
jgi:hypothetical protein